MTENNFHAGRTFEPLGNGTTRVQEYAEGGALISDKILPDGEAMKLIGKPIEWGSDVHINHEHQANHSDSSESAWWNPLNE